MKNYISLSIYTKIIILLLLNKAIISQVADVTTVNDLISPITPVFSLMGVSPIEAEKPETPKAFGVLVLNSLSSSESIPKNFSVSIAPFWLLPFTSKNELSYQEYYNPGVLQSTIQNLSLSIGTSKLESPLTGTAIGIGINTMLISGHKTRKLSNVIDYIKMSHDSISHFREALIMHNVRDTKFIEIELLGKKEMVYGLIRSALRNVDTLKNAIDSFYIVNNSQDTLSHYRNIVFDKIDKKTKGVEFKTDSSVVVMLEEIAIEMTQRYDSVIAENVKILNDENKKRTGFRLELSTALTGDIPNDSIQLSHKSKFGVWLTSAFGNENFSILFTGRYIHDFLDSDNKQKFDYGLGLMYEKNKWGISGEAVARVSATRPTYKFVLNTNYKFSDNSYLIATFGKNFDGNFVGRKGNLISILGVSLGFGKDPVVKLHE